MEAVILAAGKGERVKLFCKDKPKLLIKIVDKPILSYVVEALVKNGVKRIVFVVGYMGDVLAELIERESRRLGFKFKVCTQEKLLGTGDALRTASPFIRGDKFLVVYGDIYFDPSIIGNLIGFSERRGFNSYMVLVRKREVSQFGVVEVEGNSVKRIIEKPSERKEGFVNTGIYLFDREVIKELSQVKLSRRGEYELTDAVNSLAYKGTVGFIRVSGRMWLDVGRPWDILDACKLELRKRPFKVVSTEGLRVIPPAYIDPTARIGGGCIVGPYVSIGRNVEIDERCVIKSTVIMDGSKIGSETRLSHSVVGEGCVLGSCVSVKTNLSRPITINIGGREMTVRRRRIGAFIGDYTIVPDSAELGPAEVIF